jgi:hypothetical protein
MSFRKILLMGSMGLFLVMSVGSVLAQRNTPSTTLFDGDAEITFQDEFDDSALSEDWIATTNDIEVDDGLLTIDASSTETDAIIRPSIGEDEGVLVLFQYTSGQMDFRLESGEEETQDYRRWSFTGTNAWRSAFVLGRSPYDLQQANLNENTWYYLLIRVGDDATFYTNVWERDNPVEYSFSHERTFTQEGWDNAVWDFAMHVQKGQLRIARYEELRFRSGFTLPDAPILHPDDLIFTDDFEDFDPKEWDFETEPTIEELDGDLAMRLDQANYAFTNSLPDWKDYTFVVDVKVTQVDPQYNAFQLWARNGIRDGYYVSLDVGTYLSYLNIYTDREFEKISDGRGSNLRRNTWHTVRFRAVGSDLKVFVDDHLIVYATNDVVTEGGIGFLVAPGAIVYFDNIRIVSMES